MSQSAAPLARPTAPLTILTLSLSRPHAVVPTIFALDHLIKYISSQQAKAYTTQPTTSTDSDNKELRPCDTFTLIAGIGFAGASLALFLGRFRMNFAALRAEWIHLTEGVDPDSQKTFSFAGTSDAGMTGACLVLLKRIGTTMPDLPKILRHHPYRAESLKRRLETLCDFYGTPGYMFLDAYEKVMCQHVVLAAAEQDPDNKKKKKKKKKEESAGYDIFRMHDPPGDSKAMDGVTDPRTTEISSVLDTIAAAEPHAYFKDSHSPFPMQMASGEKAKHDAFRIVEIALEEVWALYGRDVPIAAIVDIGDGFKEWEDGADVRDVAKCLGAAGQQMGGAAPISGDEVEHGREHGSGEGGKMAGGDDTVQEEGEAKMVGEKDTAHQNDEASSTKVRGEDKVQKDVEAKLREIYGDDAPPFFRIKGHR